MNFEKFNYIKRKLANNILFYKVFLFYFYYYSKDLLITYFLGSKKVIH